MTWVDVDKLGCWDLVEEFEMQNEQHTVLTSFVISNYMQLKNSKTMSF